MNQFLGSLLLIPAEQMLNHLLANDDYLAVRLRRFSGKSICLHSRKPTSRITLHVLEGRVRLSSLDADQLDLLPDASITGDAGALLGLLTDSGSKPLANTAIEITGDALLVQDLFTTVRGLDLDWLDYLSPFLGEILTHELGQASVQARQWSAQARENLGRNVDAYLKEELQLLPDRERMRHFSNQLDHLRLRLDRLRARTELLQSRLDKSLKNQHLSS